MMLHQLYRPYMIQNAEESAPVKRIAYPASFGMCVPGEPFWFVSGS